MMKKYFFIFSFLLLINSYSFAQITKGYDAVYSGVPWFDDRGKIVSAHGACIIKHNNRFYLFGEAHDDTSNAFAGFNCYSSTDLYNWKFESIALPVQDSGKLGSNTVGERVKVMRCPSTGEYIMYMHTDNMQYKDQYVGYAAAQNITGPYTFNGPLLFNEKPIKKWDMGTFQDDDGNGYVLLHGGDIYKLGNDYKTIVEQTCKAFERGFEAPAMFKKDSLYYFIGSDLTGWERNDNYYFTATSLQGAWIKRGFIAPKGTLTWNSQTTFVLPVQGTKQTTYMFMGDRWSFPKQASAATYVWQPLTVNGYNISIPEYKEGWKINITTGEALSLNKKGKSIAATDEQIVYSGNWLQDTLAVNTSNEKTASFSFTTKATQIALYTLARNDGGYAVVTVTNSKNKVVCSSNIDMYSKYSLVQLKLISPVMPKDIYTVKVEATGEHWYWKEKSGKLSGSLGNIISLDKIIVYE
jgi:hypothetical protein